MESFNPKKPGVAPEIVDAAGLHFRDLLTVARQADSGQTYTVFVNCAKVNTADMIAVTTAGQGWVAFRLEPDRGR